jgi:hypothetical protein
VHFAASYITSVISRLGIYHHTGRGKQSEIIIERRHTTGRIVEGHALSSSFGFFVVVDCGLWVSKAIYTI